MIIIAKFVCVSVLTRLIEQPFPYWQREHGWWSEGSTAPQCRPSASSWRTPGRWCPPRPWWNPSPPELVDADSNNKKYGQNSFSVKESRECIVSNLTMLDLQEEQMKQSLCQCRPSKEMNLVPPIPETPLSSHAPSRQKRITKSCKKRENVSFPIRHTSDGFAAGCATLGEELAEAILRI